MFYLVPVKCYCDMLERIRIDIVVKCLKALIQTSEIEYRIKHP